jgi:hypothetical protein
VATVVVTAASAAPPEGNNNPTASDAQLRTRLEAEYPELNPRGPNDQQLDDWGKVVRLREFSYRHTAYANNVESDSYRAGAAMVEQVLGGRKSLAEAYEFFDAGNGGVVCGGTATLLCQLFRWAGYDAWGLNTGFYPATPKGSAFTHVVVLARITVTDANGKKVQAITIHDPSANVSFTHSDGRTPLDYYELLTKLTNRKAAEVGYFGTIPGPSRRADPITVAFADETAGRKPRDFAGSWNIGGDSFTWSSGRQGQWIFRSPRTVRSFEQLGDVIWKPQLVQEGLPGQTLYIFCRPFQIGGRGGEELLTRAREVLAIDK